MLDLVNVGKVFNPGTVNEKKALSGVNFHLEEGDFATIVGSNGAGKSTLFNAIAGEFIADAGTSSSLRASRRNEAPAILFHSSSDMSRCHTA